MKEAKDIKSAWTEFAKSAANDIVNMARGMATKTLTPAPTINGIAATQYIANVAGDICETGKYDGKAREINRAFRNLNTSRLRDTDAWRRERDFERLKLDRERYELAKAKLGKSKNVE